MNSIATWFAQLDFTDLISTILVVLASLTCITIHETCHGLVAYWLGDPTAKRQGRLTLNPVKHVDLMGLIMMAIFKFGWAKPVPVDMRRFKNPKQGMALTALAGPVSNILLTLLALIIHNILQLNVEHVYGNRFLMGFQVYIYYVIMISTGLAVFNLIPISPLDGSKVLYSFLPNKAYAWLMHYERYGMILLFILMFTGIFDTPLFFLRDGLLNVLSKIAGLPFRLF